jgi:hypothetical protein
MLVWYVREAFLNQIGRSLPSYRIIKETEQAGAGV